MHLAFAFLVLNSAIGQNIATKDAIADLEFLNRAVVEGHPVNYLPGQQTDILAVLEKAKTIGQDSISERRFQKLLREAFYEIVITDGFTASASTMVTSWLKQHSKAIFIGQQASGGYNGNNGGSFPIVQLPRSKTEIQFPAYRLVLDAQSNQRTGLLPDVLVEYGIDAILAKKDLELEAVGKLCR